MQYNLKISIKIEDEEALKDIQTDKNWFEENILKEKGKLFLFSADYSKILSEVHVTEIVEK